MSASTSPEQSDIAWTREWLDGQRMEQEKALLLAPVPWSEAECSTFVRDLSSACKQMRVIMAKALTDRSEVFLLANGSSNAMSYIDQIIVEDVMTFSRSGRGELIWFFLIRFHMYTIIDELMVGSLRHKAIEGGMDEAAANVELERFSSIRELLDKCYKKLRTLPSAAIVKRLGLDRAMPDEVYIEYTRFDAGSRQGGATTCDIQTSPTKKYSFSEVAETGDGTSQEGMDDEKLSRMLQIDGRLALSTLTEFQSLLQEVCRYDKYAKKGPVYSRTWVHSFRLKDYQDGTNMRQSQSRTTHRIVQARQGHGCTRRQDLRHSDILDNRGDDERWQPQHAGRKERQSLSYDIPATTRSGCCISRSLES
jgi:hypothetical protein